MDAEDHGNETQRVPYGTALGTFLWPQSSLPTRYTSNNETRVKAAGA
jgi:hypothetical protein